MLVWGTDDLGHPKIERDVVFSAIFSSCRVRSLLPDAVL